MCVYVCVEELLHNACINRVKQMRYLSALSAPRLHQLSQQQIVRDITVIFFEDVAGRML